MKIDFVVPGEPQPKQRPRVVMKFGHARAYTPQKTHEYEDKVRYEYVKKAGRTKLEGAIEANIKCIFEPPKSVSKKKRQKMLSGEIPHLAHKDCDNLAKSILDALNEIAYDDDKQINKLYVEKRYGEPARAEVSLQNKNKNALYFF